VLALNPLAGIVAAFRSVLYERRWPPADLWVGAGVLSAVLVVGGLQIFRRLGSHIAEEV
jgi:ABC-type polysaccharide/polyol phosphate export permease